MRNRSKVTKDYYETYSDFYLKENFRIAMRATIVKDLLGDVKNCTLLDVGCGDGSISRPFINGSNRLTLVDLSASMLKKAESNVPAVHKAQVDFAHCDLYEFSPNDCYDIVICIGVLAHVDSLDEALRKIAALLQHGGRCVIEFHDDDRVAGRMLSYYYALKRRLIPSAVPMLPFNIIRTQDIVPLLASHGLEVASIKRHLLLLPGMGRLPARWLHWYDSLVYRCAFLSRHASEAIVLCEKRR